MFVASIESVCFDPDMFWHRDIFNWLKLADTLLITALRYYLHEHHINVKGDSQSDRSKPHVTWVSICRCAMRPEVFICCVCDPQEPSTKRVKPLSRVTSLASLIPPVKAAPLKRIGQTLQVQSWLNDLLNLLLLTLSKVSPLML